MKNYHVCTFSPKDIQNITFDVITHFFGEDLTSDVYVYELPEENKILFAYNVEIQNGRQLPENSFISHKKADVGTIYTINALNEIIMNLNNGILDKRFKIDWTNFQSKLITTDNRNTLTIKNIIFIEKKVV